MFVFVNLCAGRGRTFSKIDGARGHAVWGAGAGAVLGCCLGCVRTHFCEIDGWVVWVLVEAAAWGAGAGALVRLMAGC